MQNYPINVPSQIYEKYPIVKYSATLQPNHPVYQQLVAQPQQRVYVPNQQQFVQQRTQYVQQPQYIATRQIQQPYQRSQPVNIRQNPGRV